MTKEPPQITEYSEPIALGGLETQFRAGSMFAPLLAVAICHELKLDFPQWVLDHIGSVCAELVTDTFPDSSPSQLGFADLNSAQKIRETETRYKKAARATTKRIGLTQDGTNAIRQYMKAAREMEIATAIAASCQFERTPTPRFIGVKHAQTMIATQYHVSSETADDAWKRYRVTLTGYYLSLPDDVQAGRPLDYIKHRQQLRYGTANRGKTKPPRITAKRR